MPSVDPTLAAWLRSAELVEDVADPAIAAAWADLATDSSQSSPIALRSAAALEASRQASFFSKALAVETIEVTGWHASLVGSSRRIAADVEEYAATPPVFVIGAEEREQGTTLLTILRKVEVA